MSDILEKTNLRFSELGVSLPLEIESLFKQLFDRANEEANSISGPNDLESFRVRWVGRKSSIFSRIQENWLVQAPPNQKRSLGSFFNSYKNHIGELIDSHKNAVEILEMKDGARAKSGFDLSLPGVIRPIGTHHLIRQMFQEIEDIFFSIGFSVVEGPEIETPYYNFEALNIPEFHPVRDDMDTFYLELPKGAPGPLLLRTHTSPVQIRTI